MAKEREVNIIVDAKNKSRAAFLEVKKDLRGLGDESEKGLGKLTSTFDRADKVIYSFADRMKWMDKIAKRTFQGTAAAAGIYIGATLKDFTQLNDGISKVNTLYDQTAESQKKMYQDSIQMFKVIPTDFKKITQGIYDTISAGGDPKYATMMARKFGMAGVAGDADMDVVTKAAMGTMNAYKAEVKDLNRILDLQFMTVKKGITSYEELASSLGTGVLASAKSAGFTMSELYGSIAMITKNAIPASIATTSLNQMFNKFTDTKVIKEFKTFGVEIQDAKKNTRPLIEIMKDLNAQFDKKKMTSEQRKGFLKELVGSEQAARAITPLLSDMKEFEEILNSMDNSTGAMKGAYEDRLNNIKTQIHLMWNEMKGTGVEQVEKLNPLVEAITGPWLEKNKLQLEILDLKDSLDFIENPERRKLTEDYIVQLEAQLENINFTPIDEFNEALAQSVDELNKFSPALGNIVDQIGTFIISFLGDEGKEKRDTAGKITKGLIYTTLLSTGSKAFRNIFGKTPWEFGKWAIPTLFGAGKGIFETGYLKTLYGAEILKGVGIGTGTAGLMGLPIVGGIAALWDNKNRTDKGKEVIENPEDFIFSFSKGQWVSRDELLEMNKNRVQMDKQNQVTIGAPSNKNIISKEEKAKQDLINKYKPELFMDMFSKIDKMQQNIDNNISMQNDISVEPPKVDVKMYVDGKSIPIQRVEVDYGKVDKHTERQSRRYGRPELSPF